MLAVIGNFVMGASALGLFWATLSLGRKPAAVDRKMTTLS